MLQFVRAGEKSADTHSLVWRPALNPGEIDLLHTPALQRLYDLHQLGLTDRIYVDASHSRFHHVVGVLEQADKIVDAIVGN